METTGFAHFKIYSKQSKFLWKSIIRLQDLLIKSWLFSASPVSLPKPSQSSPHLLTLRTTAFFKVEPSLTLRILSYIYLYIYPHPYLYYIYISIYTPMSISISISIHTYIYIHMYVVNISKTAAVLFRCVTTVTGASSTARWTSMPCKTSWDRESTWPRIGGLNHNSPDYIVVRCG